MARLEPTVARLIRPEWATTVPSPAHDALTPEARRRYVAANPDSFLTVTRGPEDLEPDEQWDSARAVRASGEALQRLLRAGAFTEPGGPALYLYQLTPPGPHDGGPRDGARPSEGQLAGGQIGIVGLVSVDDYEQGIIRVHEQVNDTRARHMADHLGGLGIQSSPITLAHRADPALAALVDRLARSTPTVLDFSAPDGLHQRIWRIDDPGAVDGLRSALTGAPLYLIDGHHRAAAAARHRRHRSPAGPDPASDPAGWMLAVIFPADRLRVEAFHRVLHGVDHEHLMYLVRAAHPVRVASGIDEIMARRPDELGLLTGDRWHLVDLGPGRAAAGRDRGATPADDALAALDAVRLENQVLRPLLDLTATAAGDRLTYRAGTPPAPELAQWRTPPGDALWLLRPAPVDVVLEAADAGRIMPPKSTFFQPKARSGIFLRSGL